MFCQGGHKNFLSKLKGFKGDQYSVNLNILSDLEDF